MIEGDALPTILRRGETGYETKRSGLVWQTVKPHRFPAEILEIVSVESAVAAVKAVRARGLQVSVVSGGHSYIGNGLRDDTVLLDLAHLTDIRIDAARRKATVGPAVRNGDLDAALESAGFAFPIGHSPSVAVGGYLLGGGLGWNPDGWGPACFGIESAMVVLASGELVTASREHHPDLFWAIQGAGPEFFGLVVSFELNLRPRPSITELSCTLPVSAAGTIPDWVERILPDKPDQIELSVMFCTVPAGSGPEATCVISAIAFTASADEGRQLLGELAATLPDTAASGFTVEARTIRELLAANDAGPQRYGVETVWADDAAAATRTAASHFIAGSAPDSLIHITYRGRPDVGADGAFTVSDRALVFSSAVWDDEREDRTNVRWTDDLVAAMAPFATGRYVNETDYIRHPEHLIDSFSSAARSKLHELRERYDSRHLFSYASDFPARVAQA